MHFQSVKNKAPDHTGSMNALRAVFNLSYDDRFSFFVIFCSSIEGIGGRAPATQTGNELEPQDRPFVLTEPIVHSLPPFLRRHCCNCSLNRFRHTWWAACFSCQCYWRSTCWAALNSWSTSHASFTQPTSHCRSGSLPHCHSRCTIFEVLNDNSCLLHGVG